MKEVKFKRTKIIASFGPSTEDPKVVKQLIEAGVNGVRLNLSHGTHESHQQHINNARSASEEIGKPIAIIVDLQGPKIRIGELPKEGVEIPVGDQVRFAHGASYLSDGVIPLQHDFADKIKPGESIYLFDGKLEVEVIGVDKGVINTKVITGGKLTSRKGINLPDTDLGGDILTTKDYEDINFAISSEADYIAMSFVQKAADINQLRSYLDEHGGEDIKIIAKIETKAGADNIDEITVVSDGVMIARGDLAIEVGPEVVPILQRKIIGLAQKYGKIAIVATQMLASMTDSPQPTRAEVSDIATAVICGADCLMLSDETNSGKYPVESVQLMKRVSLYTESNSPVEPLYINMEDDSQGSAIASAAITLAHQLKAKMIVAETASGRTARNIASHRPQMPIIMATTNRKVAQQLAIVYGGKSFYYKSPKGAGEKAIKDLKKHGNLRPKDMVVLTYGENPGVAGGTDTIKVREIS
ncbi:MAG: pyruvate kinase [Candidatus Saccharimonadales bacterium]